MNKDLEILKSLPKHFSVNIRNKEDFKKLMFFFNNCNIIWISGTRAMNKEYDSSYSGWINYNISGDREISINSYPLSYNIVSLRDITGDKKYIVLKNKEIDPFEEEDWGYTIQESKAEWMDDRFLVKVSNNREYINLLRFFQALNICWRSGRNAIDGPDCDLSDYTFPYYILYEEHAIALRESNSDNKKELPIEYFIKDKKIKKNINPDIDPFEEEDWGYTIQESNEFFDGTELQRYVFVYDTVEECRDIAKYFSEHGYKIYSHDEVMQTNMGIYWKCWVYLNSGIGYYFMLANNVFLKNHPDKIQMSYADFLKIKASNKLNKIKPIENTEIDPFNEEDWGYTIQESIESLPDSFCVKVNNEYEYADIMNFFEKNKIYWNGQISNNMVLKYDKNAPYIHYNYMGKKALHKSYKAHLNELSIDLIIDDNKKYVPIRNKELDPLDEEDWGYTIQESISGDDLIKLLNGRRIKFDNIEECRIIATILKDYDCIVYNYESIMNDVTHFNWNTFVVTNTAQKTFSRGVIKIHSDNYLTFDEFLKLTGSAKKMKKIENTDIDPFSEEDWGYTIQEHIDELPDSFRVTVNDEYEFYRLMKYFKSMGITWNGGIASDDVPYDPLSPIIYYNYENNKILLRTNMILGYIPEFPLSALLSSSKMIPLRNKELDPLDEEDWGYTIQEALTYNGLDKILKSHIIIYHNLEECRLIAEKLRKLRYNIYNYNEIMNLDEMYEWRCFRYSPVNGGEFTRSRINDLPILRLNFKEFIALLEKVKSVKKIENPEIDPLGEEDWGYEIQENYKIKRVGL